MIQVSIAALLATTSLAHGATAKAQIDFTEDKRSTRSSYSQKVRAATAEKEAQELEKSHQIQSARSTYQKFYNRLRVPGFISASPIPQIGKIVGPNDARGTAYRMGDVLYARWAGAPLPKPGDRYASYNPAVVLQNTLDPTDFEVFNSPGPMDKLPKDRRLAGYFYESTGRLKVVKVEGGLVRMIVEQLSGEVTLGSEIMQLPPMLENITPIQSGIQLSAAIVCGSPPDRISTTQRSYLYLNRGSRDGIRVGRIFESIERVRLDDSITGAAPEISNGEAVVVHVTDSYSTAMITKQFDVIRIGSLLRTKQEETPVVRNSPFQNYDEEKQKDAVAPTLPEVPSKEAPPGATDESLPEPRKRPSAPALSELDEMERSLKLKTLTPAEKARLDKLSQQEKVGSGKGPEEDEELSETPGAPTIENSFKEGKKTAKKDTKKAKKKSKNDEEELNLLMMQN